MSRRPHPRPPWSWPGVVAFVLAVCVGGGWLIGIGLAALEATGPDVLDAELASLLNGLGQVLAGALATYLGYSVGSGPQQAEQHEAAQDHQHQHSDDQPQP